MNINFELYRIFCVVAANENITKAAKELNISQPAVSKSIKNLEAQLGGILFTRTKHGVFLTEEGKEFYNCIKQAMEYINNAENKFSNLINLEIGIIKIGVSTTLTKKVLVHYLDIFHKNYPKIKIEIITNVSSELVKFLRDGLIDLIIVNLPCSGSDIEFIKIKKIQDCFIVGKNYIELVNKKMSLADLANYPLIFQAKGSISRTFLDNFLEKNNVLLKPSMNLTSYSLVEEFTRIGFGIGYATYEFLPKELINKDLFVLDVKPSIPNRYIAIGFLKNKIPSFCAKKLIEIITNNAKNFID